MRIGILTQSLLNNYGGLLQNFALQTVLRRMGHEVTTIDWDARFSLKENLWRIRMRLLYLISNSHSADIKYIPNKTEEAIISQNTSYFIKKYIERTATAYSKQALYKRASELNANAYIVGSDQVWRAGYNAFPTAMFLDFVKEDNVKRIAYAASFGSDKWGYDSKDTGIIKQLAQKFNLITVREISGIDICKTYLGVDAIHVLDPTMLLERDDYEKIVLEEEEPKSPGTLFHYILDPKDEKRMLIEKVARINGLVPFTIMPKYQAENRTKSDVKQHISDCVFPTVTSWLRGFMDAKMVIVDSFHGAVFSIIFNKPFWVIGNKGRGNARFESLLGMFNLMDRFIEDPSSMDVDINTPIDWNSVNRIKELNKQKSISLLMKGLI